MSRLLLRCCASSIARFVFSLGFSLSLICGLGRRMRRLLLRCCGDMIAGFVSEVSGFSLGLVWV